MSIQSGIAAENTKSTEKEGGEVPNNSHSLSSLRSLRPNSSEENPATENTKSTEKDGIGVKKSSPSLSSLRSLRPILSPERIQELCDIVRQTAYNIHVYHGHGHLEKVYENALSHRLDKQGIKVQQQYPLTVRDEDGTILGDYVADLLVEDSLIVELKAARTIAPEHVAQVLGYLKSSRKEHALLINFGSYKFELRKLILGQPEATHL